MQLEIDLKSIVIRFQKLGCKLTLKLNFFWFLKSKLSLKQLVNWYIRNWIQILVS